MKYRIYLPSKSIVSEKQEWHFNRSRELSVIRDYINFSIGAKWHMNLSIGANKGSLLFPIGDGILFKKEGDTNFITLINGEVKIDCYNFKELIAAVEKICDLQCFS